jgi:hypothetical protein
MYEQLFSNRDKSKIVKKYLCILVRSIFFLSLKGQVDDENLFIYLFTLFISFNLM